MRKTDGEKSLWAVTKMRCNRLIMNRSRFAITRLIVLPYSALLLLYLIVVGGGGAWLYGQVRAVETRLLIDNMMTTIEPLAEKLRSVDALATMRDSTPWLLSDVRQLFANMPALRNVSVRDGESGFKMDPNAAGVITSRAIAPLPADARPVSQALPPGQRLHYEAGVLYQLSFDLNKGSEALIRLDFAFDREMLLKNVEDGMRSIRHAILLFMAVGVASILIAIVITAYAMRTTRQLESHFQELYQRASLAEMTAHLVHNLRNYLASLRANLKALLVSPQHTQEIVEDLDQEVVRVSERLSSFLDATRPRDEAFAVADIGELIGEAVRLAEPVLQEHGLRVETDIPPGLPQAQWQKAALRDALLNILINAAQSGQREGAVRVRVEIQDEMARIMVEDSGDGIDQEHLAQVFEPFYTTRDEGNGLGLAYVQQVMLAAQGRVQAENRSGGGTRFVLSLPLRRKVTPHWWKKFKKHSPT